MELQNLEDIEEASVNDSQYLKISKKTLENLIRKIPYTILDILKQHKEPLSVEQIKENLISLTKKNLTDQAIYYHLKKLKELGFIDSFSDQKVDMNERLYNIQRFYLRSTTFFIDLENYNAYE